MKKNNLHVLNVDEETFFLKKNENGKISFHVGYTEFEMSVKETKELINLLKTIIKE